MKKIIYIFLLVICCILVGCGDNSSEKDKKFSQLDIDEQHSYLMVAAEDTIKNNLKSPSTSKFPTYNNAQFKSIGENEYEITSYVDAENGFGATIRSYFTVKVKIDENYNEENNGYGCNVEDVKIE